MSVLAAALFVVIGILLVLLGAGGSILTVPVLVYVAGLDVHQAAATSLLIVGLVAAVGAILRRDAIEPATGLMFAATGMVGAGGGAWLHHQVPSGIVLLTFALTLFAAAAAMTPAWTEDHTLTKQVKGWPTVGTYGAVIGVATGFFGVGGGFLIVPALRLGLRLAVAPAMATSLLIIAFNSFAGFIGHLALGPVPWKLGLGFTGTALVGAVVALPFTKRISGDRLQQAFAGLLVLVGSVMLLGALRELTG